MRAMASRLLSSLKSHPLIIASSVLLLFALPIFRMLIFFWPLIASTVLGVLAVVSFGRTTDEHDVKPRAPESAVQADAAVAFSSHEGKIGNVLMVGNREVTWLEWLHNEDTQKLCIHEHEPGAVWDGDGDADADGCDGIPIPGEVISNVTPSSTDVSTGKHDVLDDAPLPTTGKGIPYVWGSPGDEQMALVSTEEDESTDAVLPSTVLDGIKATDIVPPALNDLNKETAMMKASTAKDKTNPGESRRVHVLEVLPSVNEAISHTSEPKIARMHEQEALDRTLSNAREMQGRTDEKNEEYKGSNQLGPQWDVSDGEEDRSGLRFSFFHNSSHTPSKP